MTADSFNKKGWIQYLQDMSYGVVRSEQASRVLPKFDSFAAEIAEKLGDRPEMGPPTVQIVNDLVLYLLDFSDEEIIPGKLLYDRVERNSLELPKNEEWRRPAYDAMIFYLSQYVDEADLPAWPSAHHDD